VLDHREIVGDKRYDSFSSSCRSISRC
jgi:hypothetical protein